MSRVRLHALVLPVVLFTLLAPRATAADAAEARVELKRLDSKFVKVGEPRLSTTTKLFQASASGEAVRLRVNLNLSNRSKVGYWLVTRLTPPTPYEGRSGIVRLEPGKTTEFEATQDTILADSDYLFDILVFADSAQTQALETHLARHRFSSRSLAPVNEDLAFLREMERARILPRTYEGIVLKGNFVARATLPSETSKHGSEGTLVVGPDGLRFAAKEKVLTYAASNLRKVAVLIESGWVMVFYEEGGEMKRFEFQTSAGTHPRVAAMAMSSIETLIQRQKQ